MAQLKRDFVFHSALTPAGPMRVTVDGAPRRLKKNNHLVVDLTLHKAGEPSVAVSYYAENEACANFFAGHKGKTFTIVAAGGGKGQEETGTITYVGESGAPAQPPPQAAPPANAPAPQQAHPPAAAPPSGLTKAAKEAAALKDAKLFVGRNESLVKIALKRAVAVKSEFEAEYHAPLPDGVLHSVFASLLYGAGGAGIADGLPPCVDFKTLGATAQAKAAAPQQQAPPPPPPPPPPKPKCPSCGTDLTESGECLNTECKTRDDVPF